MFLFSLFLDRSPGNNGKSPGCQDRVTTGQWVWDTWGSVAVAHGVQGRPQVTRGHQLHDYPSCWGHGTGSPALCSSRLLRGQAGAHRAPESPHVLCRGFLLHSKPHGHVHNSSSVSLKGVRSASPGAPGRRQTTQRGLEQFHP